MDRPRENKRLFGFGKETLAVEFLQGRGVKTLQRNYQCRLGEIDIIAEERGNLIFLEVKFRKDDKFGSALEMVTRVKQRKIVLCAKYYLLHNPAAISCNCRFDVIGISPGLTPGSHSFQWIRNAFQS